jgi:hypothetical protein
MRFVIATPNPYVLKMFSKVFRNTQERDGDMWMTLMIDACHAPTREKLPHGTVWITPHAHPTRNTHETVVASHCPQDSQVFTTFKNALHSLDQINHGREVDWVVVTPFGSTSETAVHDMHAAYAQYHQTRLQAFRNITSDNV